jgi:hypothetical protein
VKAVYDVLLSSVESMQGQPGVNLHRPTMSVASTISQGRMLKLKASLESSFVIFQFQALKASGVNPVG